MEASPLPTKLNRRLAGPEAANRNENLPFHRERLPLGSEPVRPLRYRWYRSYKPVVDFLLAALLTVPAVPLILVAAVLVKLTSRGPAFYTQTRVGEDGRPFTIWKIRSMIHNCESLTGPRWSMPGDPRVTRIGVFLRASHLDELPQLLNVLRGEMSLIGPRPERPEFVPELERELPGYWQRLTVRPGVTGLAQVQLPPDSDLSSVRRKLAHDLYYIRHLSPWLDARLLLGTAVYALGWPFGVLRKLLGIPDGATVEEAMKDVLGDLPAPRVAGASEKEYPRCVNWLSNGNALAACKQQPPPVRSFPRSCRCATKARSSPRRCINCWNNAMTPRGLKFSSLTGVLPTTRAPSSPPCKRATPIFGCSTIPGSGRAPAAMLPCARARRHLAAH